MLYLSIPGTDYLKSLFSNDKFLDYAYNGTDYPNIGILYHSVHPEVLASTEYLNYMQKHFSGCQHIIDCESTAYHIVHNYISNEFTNRYHNVVPRLFPKITYKENEKAKIERERILNEFSKRKINAEIAVPGKEINFDSKNSYVNTPVSAFLLKSTDYVNQIAKAGDAEKQELYKPLVKQSLKFKNEPYIIFLGTGSLKPSPYRAHSAIYMNIPGNEKIENNENPDYQNSQGILLDCGEPAYNQLLEHFDSKEIVGQILKKISLIYITHFHLDHYTGLFKIIKEADNEFCKSDNNLATQHLQNKLFIVAPNCIHRDIEIFLRTSNLKYPERISLISSQNIKPDTNIYYKNLFDKNTIETQYLSSENITTWWNSLKTNSTLTSLCNYIEKQLCIQKIYSFETKHCAESQGIVLEGPNWKIVYTGDTSYCKNVVNYSKNVTLLITECTIHKGVEEVSKSVGHLNMQDIIKLRSLAKPSKIILTHFSKIMNQWTDNIDDMLKHEILCAHDHMQLRLSDIEWAYKINPALEKVKISNLI